MKTLTLLLLLTATQEVPRQSEQPNRCLRIEVNLPSKAQLLRMEGMTEEIANMLIKGRPYKSFKEFKEKLPKDIFEKNKSKVCYFSREHLFEGVEPKEKRTETPNNKDLQLKVFDLEDL